MSISVLSNRNATTPAASGSSAVRRIAGRLGIPLPRRAYSPGDPVPGLRHRGERFADWPYEPGKVVRPDDGKIFPKAI